MTKQASIWKFMRQEVSRSACFNKPANTHTRYTQVCTPFAIACIWKSSWSLRAWGTKPTSVRAGLTNSNTAQHTVDNSDQYEKPEVCSSGKNAKKNLCNARWVLKLYWPDCHNLMRSYINVKENVQCALAPYCAQHTHANLRWRTGRKGQFGLLELLDSRISPGITKEEFKYLFVQCACGEFFTRRAHWDHACSSQVHDLTKEVIDLTKDED